MPRNLPAFGHDPRRERAPEQGLQVAPAPDVIAKYGLKGQGIDLVVAHWLCLRTGCVGPLYLKAIQMSMLVDIASIADLC